jgi:hypothetical protein
MGMGGNAGLGAPAGGVGLPPASQFTGTLGQAGQAGGGGGSQPWLTPWNPFANLEQQSAGGLAGGGGQGGSFGIIGQRGQGGQGGQLGGQAGAGGPMMGNWYGNTAPGTAVSGLPGAPAGARLPPAPGGKGGGF